VNIDEQEIELSADTFMPVDENCLPTSEIKSVSSLGIDLRRPKKFADIFNEFGDVDNSFLLTHSKNSLKNQKEVHFAARISSPKTGRILTILTTEPVIQLYTSNFLQNAKTCNGNHKADKHFAFCVETQRPPNAINIPHLREYVILRPSEVYYHKSVHEFSTILS